jgi:hypothetical protein
LSTPDDLSTQCVFIDYVYKDLEKQVNEFNEEEMFKRYTPCGRKYVYCLYYFLRDMSFFNLLTTLEDKCVELYGSCFLETLNDSYENPKTGCPVSLIMRQEVEFKPSIDLLEDADTLLSILVKRFHFRENILMRNYALEALQAIKVMELQKNI